MKVEYVEIWIPGEGFRWIWRLAGAKSERSYSREGDAKRGFERFCRAIGRVKK